MAHFSHGRATGNERGVVLKISVNFYYVLSWFLAMNHRPGSKSLLSELVY